MCIRDRTTGADPNAVSIFRPNTTDHSSSTTSVSSLVSGDSATLSKVNTSYGGNNLQSLAPFSGGMSFTGTNANDGGWKINPTSAYDFGTNDWTIESWARRFGSDGVGHQYIIDWAGTNSYDRISLGFLDGNNAYLGEALAAEGYTNIDLESSGWFTPQNTWIHWAFVKESGTTTLYVNGTRKAYTANASAVNWNSARSGVLAFNQRHGSDSNGWHSDNEKELGENPIIASLSLGASRKFKLRNNRNGENIDLILENGSLLIMAGSTQTYWKHTVPKTRQNVSPRISLTYRVVYNLKL